MTRSRAVLGLLLGGLACGTGAPPAPPPPTVLTATTLPTTRPTLANCATPPAAPDAGAAADDDYPTDGARVATSANACAVADSNVQRAEDAILALPAPHPAAASPARSGRPERLDRVTQRFALSNPELATLAANGFVVPERLTESSYAWAFHEIYQSELPVYISVDAIFHAVYAAHDTLLGDLERHTLAPLLDGALSAMHCALAASATAYPAATARDLDVYLTVARSLLADHAVASVLGDPTVDTEAAALVAQAHEAAALAEVALFGRQRMIDWTQLTPRGHYTTDLAPYFRATMWVTRLELNLVSRSSRSSQPGDAPDPSETPREDVLALAMADLATRSGAAPQLARIDRAFELFAGEREDVSIADLTRLRAEAHLDDLRAPDAAARLRAAIGDRYQRTAQLHYMPQGSTVLPAIATLLGPRVVADTAAVRPIVHSAIPDRHQLSGADFAAILGSDRALTYLADELRKFPGLAKAIQASRFIINLANGDARDNTEANLYEAWLTAIHGLAATPDGARPTYMSSAAFADLRVDSMVAAYAQLRHGNLLLAGQAYDEGGCDIPDGWVDPAPAVYEALMQYADRGARAAAELDPTDKSGAHAYFLRLGRVMKVLDVIAKLELAGQPLPPAALRFLSMVSEMSPGSTGGPPTYTGWYFDLFQHRQDDGLRAADLVADVYTSSEAGITYLGVSAPRLGVFVVDTGGAPRVMVGPVAHAWQHQGPLDRRLDDEAAAALPAGERGEPWSASYAIAAPVEPALTATFDSEGGEDHGPDIITVQAKAAVGPVTIELLDHHRRPLAHLTHTVGAGKTAFAFPRDKKKPWESFSIHAGAAHGWGDVSDTCSCASVSLGGGVGDDAH